jgi:hypothetical protein
MVEGTGKAYKRARAPYRNLLLANYLTKEEVEEVIQKFNAGITKTGMQALNSAGKSFAKARAKFELVKMARKMYPDAASRKPVPVEEAPKPARKRGMGALRSLVAAVAAIGGER